MRFQVKINKLKANLFVGTVFLLENLIKLSDREVNYVVVRTACCPFSYFYR
jgi:hypothetical protein